MELDLRHDVMGFIALAKQALGGSSSVKFRGFERAMQSYLAGAVSCTRVTEQVEALMAEHPALKSQFQLLAVSRVAASRASETRGSGGKQQQREKRPQDGRGSRAGSGGEGAACAKKRHRPASRNNSGASSDSPTSPLGNAPFHPSSSSSSSSGAKGGPGGVRPLYEGDVRNSGVEGDMHNAFAHYSASAFTMHGVAVIDVRHACARALVTRERRNGNPVILEHHEGWLDFAKQWVKEATPQSAGGAAGGAGVGDANANANVRDMGGARGQELDADRFIADVGAETLVPIVRPGYDEHEPVKEHMAVGEFMERYWKHNDSGAYLHQWQFAITGDQAVRDRLLNGGSKPLSCLGHNMLCHWLDICRGANPLQVRHSASRCVVVDRCLLVAFLLLLALAYCTTRCSCFLLASSLPPPSPQPPSTSSWARPTRTQDYIATTAAAPSSSPRSLASRR